MLGIVAICVPWICPQVFTRDTAVIRQVKVEILLTIFLSGIHLVAYADSFCLSPDAHDCHPSILWPIGYSSSPCPWRDAIGKYLNRYTNLTNTLTLVSLLILLLFQHSLHVPKFTGWTWPSVFKLEYGFLFYYRINHVAGTVSLYIPTVMLFLLSLYKLHA